MNTRTPLTVAALIKALQSADPNLIVILSRDEEGNGYLPLYESGVSLTNHVYTQDGEIKIAALTPSLRKQRYTQEDVGKGIPCIILYP